MQVGIWCVIAPLLTLSGAFVLAMVTIARAQVDEENRRRRIESDHRSRQLEARKKLKRAEFDELSKSIGELPCSQLATSDPAVRSLGIATRSSIDRDVEWFRTHSQRYLGRWVALRDGELIDSDESRVALHRRLESSLDGLLFAFIPPADW